MALATTFTSRFGQSSDNNTTAVSSEETPLASARYKEDHLIPLELSNGGTPTLFNVRVGGDRFSVLKCDLDRIPGSRLQLISSQNRVSLCHGVFDTPDGAKEYYFDRSAAIFDSILNTYRTGYFHISDHACPQELLEELSFWMIDPGHVALCCRPKLKAWELAHPGLLVGPNLASDGEMDTISSPTSTGTGNQKSWRQRAWILLEMPGSSKGAMIYMLCSCVMVLTTMVALIMGSMEEFQYVATSSASGSQNGTDTNVTYVQPGLEIADAICVTWFSMDYLVRLWASPDRWIYFKTPLSIIDLLSVLPFYVEILFNYLGIQLGAFGDLRRSLIILRILRVLRVLRALRVLKVARYSSGFQSMGKALHKSWRELALLVMFTLTANLMFSTAMYYVEYDYPKTHFSSIPVACWWCIITMTTVGYGDVYPQTTAGMLVGAVVSISGIILLAFPISIIVENFNEEYEQLKTHRTLQKLSGDLREGTKNSDSANHQLLAQAMAVSGGWVNRHFAIINGKPHLEISSHMNNNNNVNQITSKKASRRRSIVIG